MIQSETGHKPKGAGELIKLLVIDDDEMDRLQLKRALKTSGLDYVLTERDDSGIISDGITPDSFDCIFLDYLLPGDNGLLLVKKIRDMGVKTPVVIVTSQGNENIAVELMKAGASDYIVKNNINAQSIGQVIRNMLRMSIVEKERAAAERALKVSEARLAEAQKIARIGNWEYNANEPVLFWSGEVYDIFGVARQTFTPTIADIIPFIHPEDKSYMERKFRMAMNGESFNIDLRIVQSSELKYITMQGHPFKGSHQSAGKIVGTVQDITERKLAEQEILKTRELAEHSMKVREIFLANMSHEIRTPMNAILGFTHLLLETKLSIEQKEFLNAIHFSGENLLVIINDILDLSKIRSGKMTLEKSDFNLTELLKGIVNILKPKALEKGLVLDCQIGGQVPQFVKGDPVRLNQILVNLISNAVKFTETGSIRLDVQSRPSGAEALDIEFSVSDTGIGIPEDKHAFIFGSFEQASSDTTRKYGGTGLGLSIVKSFVELHGGAISLVSAVGRGSTFIVDLSFEKADVSVVPELTASIPSLDYKKLLSGVSILIVDDNELNQLLARKALKKVGCVIETAFNGVKAIEKLESGKYDIVLMDIQMPEMDGYEATRHIRTKLSQPVSDIPIIAMTAHAFSSDTAKCIEAGMNDYMSKPYKQEALFSKIVKNLVPRVTPIASISPESDSPRFDKNHLSTFISIL